MAISPDDFRQAAEHQQKALLSGLNRGVDQPPCGCAVVWEWRFTPEVDLLPASLEVKINAPCEAHKSDPQFLQEMTVNYHERLWFKRENFRMKLESRNRM